jgi:3-oxoacyl-[acyl-carrier protein] reductase
MKPLLEDRVAIVTGAGSGIGLAIATQFAHQGALVAMIGRNLPRLEAAAASIQAQVPGARLICKSADVAKSESITVALDEILAQTGRCDVLVNNAGITQDSLLMKMTDAQWDEVIATNLRSVFVVSRHLIRTMLRQRSGSIINVGSVSGLMGNPGQCNYAATKAGMIGFSKSLAKEVASRGIRVNVIAPGFVETQMTESLGASFEARYRQLIPLERFGKPEEIADVALFLASHMSSYVTGQVLAVDGGLFMA